MNVLRSKLPAVDVFTDVRWVSPDSMPAYINYFHQLANSGVGTHDNNHVFIYLTPTDRRVYDQLAMTQSITLSYAD